MTKYLCRCPACGSSKARLSAEGQGICPACQHRWWPKVARQAPSWKPRRSYTSTRKFF